MVRGDFVEWYPLLGCPQLHTSDVYILGILLPGHARLVKSEEFSYLTELIPAIWPGSKTIRVSGNVCVTCITHCLRPVKSTLTQHILHGQGTLARWGRGIGDHWARWGRRWHCLWAARILRCIHRASLRCIKVSHCSFKQQYLGWEECLEVLLNILNDHHWDGEVWFVTSLLQGFHCILI